MDPFGCELTARARLRERTADARRAARRAPLVAVAHAAPAAPPHRPWRARRLVGGWLVRAGRWIGGLDDGRAALAPPIAHDCGR